MYTSKYYFLKNWMTEQMLVLVYVYNTTTVKKS